MAVKAEEVVQQILAAKSKSEARRLILRSSDPHLPELVYDEIRNQLSRSYERALFIAEVGTAFKSVPDQEAWGYRCQGIAERLRGRWGASAKTLIHAAELAPKSEAPEFLIPAIDSLARAGKRTEAVELGSSTYEQAKAAKLGQLVLGRLANNTANAFTWFDDYSSAEPWYRKAADHFARANSPIERASALLGLSTSTMGRRMPSVTIDLAAEAKEIFDEEGAEAYAGSALMNIASAERMQFNGDLAIKALIEARTKFDPDEEEAFRAEHDLGMTYLSLNLWVEAEATFRAALKSRWLRESTIFRAGCWQGLAEAQQGQNQHESAKKSFAAALRLYRKYGDPLWYADCLRVSCSRKAALSLSKKKELRSLADDLSRSKNWHQLMPILILLAKHGDADALNEAERIDRRLPFGNFTWQLIALRAKNASGKRRERLFDRMTEAIWKARLKAKSQSSLAAFLGDKLTVLDEYISELLERQTKESTQKAISIIRQMRSISLIDEILGASRPLSEEQQKQLDELRTQFQQQSESPIDRNSRRLLLSPNQVSQLQKSWFEMAHSIRDRVLPRSTIREADEMLYVDCGSSLYQVKSDQAKKLSVSRAELESRLRWLHFSLAEPGMNRQANPDSVLKDLKQLASELGIDPQTAVSPESVFWSVPWQAMTPEQTVRISLTPGQTAAAPLSNDIKKVVIWYHDAPDIPHVREEVEMVKQHYPGAVVCRSLSEARASLAAGDIDLLHVSCHAVYRPAQPAFSAFELADGLLYAAEIGRSQARIGSAILASCHAGAMSAANRTEPDGLSRSILARGASRVIAGQWAIDDKASLLWTSLLYNELSKSSQNLDECAEIARRHLSEQMPHPYYWASFASICGCTANSSLNDKPE